MTRLLGVGVVIVALTTWIATSVRAHPRHPSTTGVSTSPPPSAPPVAGIPLVDDSGAVVFELGGDPETFLRVSRSPSSTKVGHFPGGMGARLRAIACVQCPDRVLVLVDGVVDVLDLRASPTLVPVGSDRFVGFGRAQPVVVVLRGSSGELLARAATEGAPALSLGTSTPDFVRYQLASSADGRHIVAAFKPSSVRVGEVRIVMLDGGSAGATSTTVPLDVRSPAALSDWSICIDPEGGRYAFVRPSGTTLAVSSAPFGAQPGPATQVPIDASSRLQGCGFVGDRVLVYGGAAGGPDQFALVAVRDGKVVGSVFPPDVSVGALGSAAVCDASGVVVVQGGLGTRTIDGETLRVATRPAVLTSGCTPRGEAYFLGSGGLVWQ